MKKAPKRDLSLFGDTGFQGIHLEYACDKKLPKRVDEAALSLALSDVSRIAIRSQYGLIDFAFD